MKTDVFPLNYFKNIWTPKQIVQQKHSFNWFQLIIVLLFLNGLMIIPVSLNYAKMETFSVENTFPETFQLVDQTVVNNMNEATFNLGKMNLNESFLSQTDNGVVAGGITNQEAEQILQDEGSVLLFLENELQIREKDNSVSIVPYTKDFDLSGVTTTEELQDAISQQWFVKNQLFVVAAFSFILFALLLTELTLLVFGAAFFLFIASKNKKTGQKTYKKAVAVVLYAAGVPSLLAMIVGMFEFNIITMMTIQSVGMIGYIWFIYYYNRIEEIKVQKAAKKQATQIHY